MEGNNESAVEVHDRRDEEEKTREMGYRLEVGLAGRHEAVGQ